MSDILLIIIVTVLAIALFAVIFGLYQKNTNAICKSKRRLDGKTALITGGTSGMGLEMAIDFAGRGARVIIACPFEEEGANAKETIRNLTKNKEVIFRPIDLSSLDSTRKFAEDILKTEHRLDILMNNAGVAIAGDFYTADGINFVMQVNYFGHFLLTILLLPLLRKSGKYSEPTRIVNTSSMLHKIGKIDSNLNKTGYYWIKTRIYSNSKLCLILFSRELTRRLKDNTVVINSVDPGAVGTNLFRECGWKGYLLTFVYGTFCKNPWEGAQTAIHVALDLVTGRYSGELFKECQLTNASQLAYDDNLAARLWDLSVKLVKLSDSEIDECFKDL